LRKQQLFVIKAAGFYVSDSAAQFPHNGPLFRIVHDDSTVLNQDARSNASAYM